MWGRVLEDIKHFILWCPFQEQRKKYINLQRPYIGNENKILGQLLFQEENIKKQSNTYYLHQIWKKKKRKRKKRKRTDIKYKL